MKLLSNLFILSMSLSAWAQPKLVEPDSIALVDDKFQELFYESIKQKGIENYDRAIVNLEQAVQLKPNDFSLYYEIGKNYLFMKNYSQSEVFFNKALEIDPSNKWIYIGLYDIYYQTKNIDKSIEVVQKLISFNDIRKIEYQDDLVSLYIYSNKLDKAYSLIEELDKTTSPNENRQLYKLQIQKELSANSSSVKDLEAQIKANPKSEQAYIALIYYYSEQNQEDKAFEVAKLLAKEVPDSKWAHVSLFKFYLDENQIEKSIKSMQIVFESKEIDSKIKHRILNEFLIFVNNNPKYDNELEKAISYFKDDKNVQVSKEVGKFFFNKQNWQQASKYFQLAIYDNSDDLESIILLLQTKTELADFINLLKQADNYLILYPLQPELYYYKGLALNQTNNAQKAKNILLEGLDYLIDNTSLEVNFYIQLTQSSIQLNDQVSKDKYQNKVESLMKSLKK